MPELARDTIRPYWLAEALDEVMDATTKIIAFVPVFPVMLPAIDPVEPSKTMVAYPFKLFEDHTVLPENPIELPVLPFPDLSPHVLTL
jgi:hypothetical protein